MNYLGQADALGTSIARALQPTVDALAGRIRPIIAEEIQKNVPTAATIFGLSVGGAVIAGLILGGYLYGRRG